MGITQYLLRRSSALKGEFVLSLPQSTRLLIIANTPLSTEDTLVKDVLRTLTIAQYDVFISTLDKLTHLNSHASFIVWWLGVNPSFPEQATQLISPTLAELYHNASAKRALWEQILRI